MLRLFISGLIFSRIRSSSLTAARLQSNNSLSFNRDFRDFRGFGTSNFWALKHTDLMEQNEPQCPVNGNDEVMKNGDKKGEEVEEKLPKLSQQEWKQYNHMADHMNLYHNHFRATWNILYSAAKSGKRPQGMSIRAFLNTALQFCGQLTMHHTIEEQHIFPILAKKMPAFKKELELLTQHKAIHEGIEKLEAYVEDCRTGQKELRMEELRVIMDGFGTTLWQHLDDEVEQLGAENMRKFWTLEEMRRMPM